MRKRRRHSDTPRENPDVEFLGLSGKTWLIVGGVAVGALLLWKYVQARKAPAGVGALPAPPGGMGCGGAPCAAPAPAPAPAPQAQVSPADIDAPAEEFNGGDFL